MKIKLKSAVAGHNWSAAAGEVVDMPDAEAQRFIAGGMASSAEQAVEQATRAPAETAARRTRKKKPA